MALDRYVIGQHLLTAARKWSSGKDGYLFHPTDIGYQLSEGERLKSMSPDPGPTKIPAALGLLRGIQLVGVRSRGDDEEWSTKPLGRRAIKRVLENPGSE